MVKAKPLATALGLSYQNTIGGRKKGCVLGLDNKRNVYGRNSKTFYFYNGTTRTKMSAEYKQSVSGSYNAVHSATLSTLVNYKYFDASGSNTYARLGYQGVVVYSRYYGITNLPDLSNVVNYWNDDEDFYDDWFDDYYDDWYVSFVEANYSIASTNQTISMDLNDVLNSFKAFGLPYDGIYGYGNCDTSVTIQGIDKNGYNVGQISTGGKEFLINFPGAVKLSIVGDKRNLSMDFTPVKPIVITDTTRLAFNQIGWLYPTDGFARQYFILSDYMKFSLENVTVPYTMSRKMIDINNNENVDYSSSYQRVTAVFKGSWTDMTANNKFVNVTKTKQTIDNSLVALYNNTNTAFPANYEGQLINMIVKLSTTGINSYYPSKNFESKLIVQMQNAVAATDGSYINVDPTIVDLNHYLDYYTHLHEMIRFYESKQPHYGFQFAAWSEGNAITLTRKTMDALGVSYTDTNNINYFNVAFPLDFSFVSQDNRNNFESYYLNATGWNASVIGYHFTNFLQMYYGSDVVYKILQKVYAANIPTNGGRNSVYDKMFIDCIKSVTSQNVFQLFVTAYMK
jgi:hypothetical protein